MRLIGIAVIRNEADILEPFVRHTLALLDELLVVDHASTDGTRELLHSLVREGLPLEVYADEVLANLQQQRCRLLFEKAWDHHGADWVFPLDADEILLVENRGLLEEELAGAAGKPLALPLQNYRATQSDEKEEMNPVRRIQYRTASAPTSKLCLPRALGWDERLIVGKGNHEVFRDGVPLPTHPAGCAALAHFALRSPVQQAIRIVTGELQKLSRGREWNGLDEHYRPGFELLLRSPSAFAANLAVPVVGLVHAPVHYRGGALRYPADTEGVDRAVRALLPLCERLARAHGVLFDALPTGRREPESDTPCLKQLDRSERSMTHSDGSRPFSGFKAVAGWEPEEGPIPEAFLPQFHWASGPETVLEVERKAAGRLHLGMEMLTYCPEQALEIEYGGEIMARIDFPETYHRVEREVEFAVGAGRARVVLRFARWLQNERDPRRLAVIFLRLVIQS